MVPPLLPAKLAHPKAPPIKCQGIKTKLTPFIAASIRWHGSGRWVEPFLGSGAVLLNIKPQRALVADTNPHIIQFYRDIQAGRITADLVREYLGEAGTRLAAEGAAYYYAVRQEFNSTGGSLPFLFLNRSCFNGMMRFNRKGGFNVPFGKKPERFRPAYISRVANQVAWASSIISASDFEFRVAHFDQILTELEPEDFLYLDPPYPGRSNDYFSSWTDEDATALARQVHAVPSGYALSMWLSNRYRRNGYIDAYWGDDVVVCVEHYYHVGPTEALRNPVTEAVVLRPGYAAPPSTSHEA